VGSSQPLIFRKGLDMKEAVAGELAAAYDSAIVDRLRAGNFEHHTPRLTVHLAREFGFCYGVDRAVDYAYQARRRFPGRNVFLTGEIIHNPHVNDQLRAAGIRFLSDPGEHATSLGHDDVVILPAFGVTVAEMARLSSQGCTLVDTTCGSVLNVWKNVVRYAREGFTAVIHGKVKHEETRATASQALKYPDGQYIVVLDRGEAAVVCDYIRHGSGREQLLQRFAAAASPGFDPDRDLQRIGCANQTTMLMSESLEMMVVVGGYNSSNTCNLARICADRVRTYHIADPSCLVSKEEVRHRPVGAPSTTSGIEVISRDWLPPAGRVVVGLTAGASTPNNIVGEVIRKLEDFTASRELP
jgi:4-hydroxy-3-methylbut-2-enyl diphosphate reductase